MRDTRGHFRRLTAQAAGKDIVEMLRTIGQVWPPAAAKVAAAGPLPASTKKAKMQVLRMVHPDKVRGLDVLFLHCTRSDVLWQYAPDLVA